MNYRPKKVAVAWGLKSPIFVVLEDGGGDTDTDDILHKKARMQLCTPQEEKNIFPPFWHHYLFLILSCSSSAKWGMQENVILWAVQLNTRWIFFLIWHCLLLQIVHMWGEEFTKRHATQMTGLNSMDSRKVKKEFSEVQICPNFSCRPCET